MDGHVTVYVQNFTVYNQTAEAANQTLFDGQLFQQITKNAIQN